jgi:hypothetical protein
MGTPRIGRLRPNPRHPSSPRPQPRERTPMLRTFFFGAPPGGGERHRLRTRGLIVSRLLGVLLVAGLLPLQALLPTTAADASPAAASRGSVASQLAAPSSESSLAVTSAAASQGVAAPAVAADPTSATQLSADVAAGPISSALRRTGNFLSALGTAAVSAVSALARGIAGVSSSIAKSVSTPSPASTPAPVSPGLSLSAGTTLLGTTTSPAIASAVLASGTTSTVSPILAPSGGRTKPAPNPTPSEIVSARTGNSRTFDNGNGTRTVELGQNLNFQSAPGQYSPVNLAFHQVGASMVEGW